MRDIPYSEVLGSLLFLTTHTRPELVKAVSMLGKYQQKPLVVHWNSMKSVVRYLIGTLDYGVLLPSDQEAWHKA